MKKIIATIILLLSILGPAPSQPAQAKHLPCTTFLVNAYQAWGRCGHGGYRIMARSTTGLTYIGVNAWYPDWSVVNVNSGSISTTWMQNW